MIRDRCTVMNSLSSAYALSPYDEMLAFEYLYAQDGMSLKRITEKTVNSNRLPSEAVSEYAGMIVDSELMEDIESYIANRIGSFSVVVNCTPNWPMKMADSERPSPLLYYQGDLSLIEMKSVSVVGAREASDAGLKRAERISKELVNSGIAVVTGLAKGIDTAASQAALDQGGCVIGVIGTPIDEFYPKENKLIQQQIAKDHLLISQVPFYRYAKEPFNAHRIRFPERNELMASITDATVIVEASDRSGTLTQARACLHQGRPLFIMRSVVEKESLTWPRKYTDKEGVYVLDDVTQVLEIIEDGNSGETKR